MKTDQPGSPGEQCYCGSNVLEQSMLTCTSCKRQFHMGCLKSGRPSPLEGDIFYLFVCADCTDNNEEEFERMKLQWLHVVMLSLYNLQLTGIGKYGYFRWKEHICAFIDKHWTTFFGYTRKKTSLWYGTVAGTLSSGCPGYFLSGAQELAEPGWWRLAEIKPPTLKLDPPSRLGRKLKVETKEAPLKVESLRSRRAKTSIAAAMELKAKRSTLTEAKDLRKKPAAKSCTSDPGVKSKERNTSYIPPTRSPQPTTSSQPMTSPQPSKSPPHSTSPQPSTSTFIKLEPEETGLPSRPGGGARHSAGTELQRPHSDRVRRPVSAPPPASHSNLMREHQIKRELPDTSLDGAEVGSMSRDSSLSGMEFGCSSSQPAPSTHSSLRGGLSRQELEEDNSSQFSHSSSRPDMWFTEKDLWSVGTIPQCLMKDDEEDGSDSELEIDPGTFSPPPGSPIRMSQSPSIHDMLSSMDDSSRNSIKTELSLEEPNTLGTSLRDEDEAESVVSSASEKSSRGSAGEESEDDTSEVSKTTAQRLYRKRKSKDEERETVAIPGPRYIPMSEYEERQLLKRLNQVAETVKLDPELCRLRRKLIVRQQKREHGQPLFNLDSEMKKIMGNSRSQEQMNFGSHPLNRFNLPMSQRGIGESRVLDRFQVCGYQRKAPTIGYSSFMNRLVGTEDNQLQPICSPYTARILKPFIRRDTESKPLKLRLLEEIQAYPYRNDPDWEAPPSSPVDYCYVRPQHIPSVNVLCREFFWPGIDLSECLQYPDFSCVVVYRKVVIGFAFMVPDIKYNEAYISFIFTHPEWRQAGIATFMLYHLIQTCMGKDVTLHVSATNSAMFLYQKFGFKPEEFILDFYDKYYPEDSKVCKHAFMLRLRR